MTAVMLGLEGRHPELILPEEVEASLARIAADGAQEPETEPGFFDVVIT